MKRSQEQEEDVQGEGSRILWVLRAVIAAEFVGYGILAISVKPEWIGFLEALNFSDDSARYLLPIVGVVDITLAFVVLARPSRPVLFAMALWAFAATLLWPIAGEPLAEFVKRAPTWGAPLTLFLLVRSSR